MKSRSWLRLAPFLTTEEWLRPHSREEMERYRREMNRLGMLMILLAFAFMIYPSIVTFPFIVVAAVILQTVYLRRCPPAENWHFATDQHLEQAIREFPGDQGEGLMKLSAQQGFLMVGQIRAYRITAADKESARLREKFGIREGTGTPSQPASEKSH